MEVLVRIMDPRVQIILGRNVREDDLLVLVLGVRQQPVLREALHCLVTNRREVGSQNEELNSRE